MQPIKFTSPDQLIFMGRQQQRQQTTESITLPLAYACGIKKMHFHTEGISYTDDYQWGIYKHNIL